MSSIYFEVEKSLNLFIRAQISANYCFRSFFSNSRFLVFKLVIIVKELSLFDQHHIFFGFHLFK